MQLRGHISILQPRNDPLVTPLQVCEALARDAGVTVDEVYSTIEKLQVAGRQGQGGAWDT